MKRFLAAAALTAVAATHAGAHRPWFLPSATIVSDTNQWVTVDAAVSNDLFFFDHQPMRLEQIKVWAPDGSPGALANGSTGRYRSTFDVKLDRPGTWKVGTTMTNVSGTFKLNGEERRVGGRGGPAGGGPGGPGGPGGAMPPMGPGGPGAMPPMGGPGGPGGPGGFRGPPPVALAEIPAGATDVTLTESVNRNEIFLTAGEPTTTVLKPTGKGLEFDPVTHPDELVSNETARFRFLIDGKPAPGIKVTVIPGGKRYRDSEGAMELTTGADGVLAVRWPGAGMFWLNAVASDDKAAEPRASQRRMSYAATLEVLAP